uniref:DDRGK domain-containing protein 1 n=1 Tax=Quercus lobata TaxID=97700 RepID=A0A7N2M9L1_QUELO
MEDLFVGILTMLLIVALIPLFLWKRRRDSQSQDENEEEREVPRRETVVRATGTRRMRRRPAAGASTSTAAAAASVEETADESDEEVVAGEYEAKASTKKEKKRQEREAQRQGGRLTLLKSTLSSLPTYYLSLFTIPKAVATRFERIQRNFLWGSLVECFKYPSVAWEKVCLLRELGSLRIRKLAPFNQALLGKWLWRFQREFNDWELAASYSLLHFIQSRIPRGGGCDRLCWDLNGNGKFDTRSFYHKIRNAASSTFPWKGIWKVKADQAARESRLTKQDRYAEMRRRKDEEREAKERMLEEEAMARKAREEEAAALEFEKWKGEISIDAEGTTENEVQDGNQDMLSHFVEYIKNHKCVQLEDIAAEFKLRTQECINRITSLESMGRLSGVMDDRGKYIYISQEEMKAVADYIKRQGRVSISHLASKSNQFIDLEPKAQFVEEISNVEEISVS